MNRLAVVVAVEPEVKPLGLSGDAESVFKEISKLGYDGVELLIKDPAALEIDKIKNLAEKFNLSIPAIGTGPTYTTYGLSLSSSNRTVREKAIERIREYIKIGKKLNSKIIIGSVKGRPKEYRRGIENLKSSLNECAEYAEEIGTCILIEPLNRYESTIINTLEEAIKLKDEIGSEKIRVMADTFHMNIEERSIFESIIKADGHLGHIHFADSNRRAPGEGHLDFKQIMSALKKINYHFFISAEILPLPNQHDAAKITIEYIKKNFQ